MSEELLAYFNSLSLTEEDKLEIAKSPQLYYAPQNQQQ